MVTGQLSAELSATCSALGHFDGLTYHIDPYCRETVKDLIRFLRKDDEEHSIRRYLGNAKIIQTDLVPILIHHSEKEELFDVVLRLLMNLTTPALIVYQEHIPSDKTERNHYLQVISQLQDYKQAFLKPEIWKVLAKKIGKLLEIETIERDEDVSRMMERILILARNVLAVPSDLEYERRPDNDATIHDKVLWAMHESGLDEIFLYIASSDKEQQVYMHILEIVSLMLREQNPTVLATSEVQRSFAEKEKDEEELLAFRQAEIRQKQLKVKKYAGARHGRFGGTFVMQGVKAAGDKDLIFHKPLEKAVSMDFNFEKKRIKKPKHLQPIKQVSEERRSTFGVRLFLKEFIIDFLNGAYNPLMRRVKDIIERGRSQGDESYYFWAMKFFMEFNRSHNFQVKLVSETVSVETFHFVQTQLQNWNDMMTTDKKKIPLWSRRMHLALNAYQELLFTLIKMDKSPDPAVQNSSKVLKSRVFYVTEYRDLLVILIHIFKENRFSRMYVKDLVETVHIFMKLLEHFCDKNRGIVVEKKKRTIQKKKKSNKSKPTEVNLELIWDQVGPQLSAVLQSDAQIPTDVVPFDAASDVDMNEQKVDAMKKIQVLLKNGDFEEAVGMLRASREVWPENDSFGAPNMAPEEEFMAMRDIFMADLGQLNAVNMPNRDEEDNEEDEEEEFEAHNANSQVQEQDMKFDEFVKRFVSEKTIQVCCMLLSKFEENTTYTNHCVIKLLHRIAWNCHMPAMAFQASLFRVFQRAMESSKPEHKELQKFGKFIVQKFLETAEKNSKVYIELLFWKKVKDAVEITEGYGSYSTKTHATKNMWTEEQEDELRRLFIEYERDNPGENPVDWIMKNLINQERSRKSVMKKLKEMYLLTKEKTIELKRSAREWSEEEIAQLRELVPQFLDAENPIECIMVRLIGTRSKLNVIQKIVDLGLVSDRKQLRKKRARKSRKARERDEDDGSGTSSGGSSSEEEEGERRKEAQVSKKERRPKQKKTDSSSLKSTNDMIKDLNAAVAAGFQEPLEWIISSLNDVLEDLEDDEECDVPLLPLTQECILAMDDPIFLQALESLGIKRPSDQQEMYWRVPGFWKEFRIKQTTQLVRDSIDGKLVPTESATDNQPKKKERKKKAKKPEEKVTTFKEILENIERTSASDSDARDSDDSINESRLILTADSSNSDSEDGSVNKSSGKTTQESLVNDSSVEEQHDNENSADEMSSSKRSRSKKLILDSSSDEESSGRVDHLSQVRSDSKSPTPSQGQQHLHLGDNSNFDTRDTDESTKSGTQKLSNSRRKTAYLDSSSEEEREDIILKNDPVSKTGPNVNKFSQNSDSESNVSGTLAHESSLPEENKNNSIIGESLKGENKRKRIRIGSSSDDSDTNIDSTEINKIDEDRQPFSVVKSNKKKKRLVIESGSEEENDDYDSDSGKENNPMEILEEPVTEQFENPSRKHTDEADNKMEEDESRFKCNGQLKRKKIAINSSSDSES